MRHRRVAVLGNETRLSRTRYAMVTAAPRRPIAQAPPVAPAIKIEVNETRSVARILGVGSRTKPRDQWQMPCVRRVSEAEPS